MTKSYGVGIIGAGWVAGEYVKAFRDHPLTQIVGMYNKTPDKATNLMKTHGVDGKEFNSVDALLDDKRIDIVVHCAHADTRAEYISRAALSGRHVVIEKPASTSPEGTAQIVEAVKKAGVKSIVSCVLRWNPQFQTIRALLDDGKLGDLMYAEARLLAPHHQGVPRLSLLHEEDLRRQQLHGRRRPRRGHPALAGRRGRRSGRLQRRPDHEQGLRVPAGDGRLAQVRQRRDRQAVQRHRGRDPLHLQHAASSARTMSIDNNRIHSSKWYPGTLGYYEFPTVKPESGDVSHHPFVPEIAHFMECIENNVESHASIHDIRKTMALCFAIDESAAKGGQPVKVKLD